MGPIQEDAAVEEIELDNQFLQDINESLPVSRRVRAGIDTGILTAGMISRELGGHHVYRVRRRRPRPRKDDSA